jgi:hypothetical protein
MRKAVLIAAAMAAVLGIAGIAYAATTTAVYDATITPANAGTTGLPTNAVYKVRTGTVSNDDGSQPPQTLTIKLAFDRNVRDNSAAFVDRDPVARRCTTSRLNRTKNLNDPACAGMKVGQANASAQLGTSQLRFQTLIYGNGANSVIVAVKQIGGSVFQAFTARIVNVSGLYRRELQITIPAALRSIGGQVFPSLTGLQQVQIGGYARKPVRRRVGGSLRTVLVGFLESVGCTGRSFKTRVTFVFTSTPTVPTVPAPIVKTDTSPCTP